MVILRSVFLLLITIQINRCWSHVWENQHCSMDTNPQMPEGIIQEINRFPWLGVVQHSFNIGGRMRYAVTTAVLVHPRYAMAPAEDMSKISAEQLINDTRLFFWGRPSANEIYSLEIKDYILHPHFKSQETLASIALLSLVSTNEVLFSDFRAPVLPICMPVGGGATYDETFVLKFTDVTGRLQKEIVRMNFVDEEVCEEFYSQNQLNSPLYNPVSPLCAVAKYNKTTCVWDAGSALIVKQAFGFWELIGFGVRGPGCGAPSKYLSMRELLPWINDIITESTFGEFNNEYVIGIRRASPIKIVLYNPKSVIINQGSCERKKRGTVLYKDWAEFSVNKDYTMGFFFVAVTQLAAFLCGEVRVLGAIQQSNAAIWVENNCHQDTSGAAIQGQSRSGDPERIDCFLFFKSTAFVEFRFTFSFTVTFSVVLYGIEEKKPDLVKDFKTTQHTTPWWPTKERLKFGKFAPEKLWWYSL